MGVGVGVGVGVASGTGLVRDSLLKATKSTAAASSRRDDEDDGEDEEEAEEDDEEGLLVVKKIHPWDSDVGIAGDVGGGRRCRRQQRIRNGSSRGSLPTV